MKCHPRGGQPQLCCVTSRSSLASLCLCAPIRRVGLMIGSPQRAPVGVNKQLPECSENPPHPPLPARSVLYCCCHHCPSRSIHGFIPHPSGVKPLSGGFTSRFRPAPALKEPQPQCQGQDPGSPGLGGEPGGGHPFLLGLRELRNPEQLHA